MTRATLFGFIILGLALAGLAVAQFSQPTHPSYTDDGGVETPVARGGNGGVKVADLERKLYELEVVVDTQRNEIRDLRSALAALGTNVAPAATDDRAPVAPVSVAPDLERQFRVLMDRYESDRAEKERQARAERTAQMFLRRVDNVSPDQRDAFSKVIALYMAERRKITREKYPTPEARQAATEALAADRNVKLQEIFDAAQYAQVSETFRWMDRGPGRGGRGNRPGR